MTESTEIPFDAALFPGIELAYPLALESYQLAMTRFEAVNSRIQTILGFGMTFTIAVPTLLSALTIKMRAGWLCAAICLFVLAAAVGVIGQLKGRLMMITPKILYEYWLQLPAVEFKKNLIFSAGQHLERNAKLIARKQYFLVASTAIFFLDALCLVFSVAFQY
jgi:hypothetical protein